MELNDAIQHLKESLADPTHKWGCEECKQEHEQLLEWLGDYKRLKDEMIPAYDEQLTEAQCKVIQQMREMKQLKADYIDLDNRLRTANTEIDRLRSESSWIPCSERMPDKDGDFICVSNGEIKILPYSNGEFYSTCFDAVFRCCNSSVTHWMPIPEPPKEYK